MIGLLYLAAGVIVAGAVTGGWLLAVVVIDLAVRVGNRSRVRE